MEVALLTVGDELLSGETVNTNANWLAEQVTARGATVVRILSIPDAKATIADRVRSYSETFDAVIVTGGIGNTPDDVTMEAVATAFDRELVVSEQAKADVEAHLAEIESSFPDLSVDIQAEASLPAGSRPLLNEVGLTPGCVIENVYVLPGIPEELKAMFEMVADEFSGDRASQRLYTVRPEANITPALEATMERFGVTVGCYPDRDEQHNRIVITGTDHEQVRAARDWLRTEIGASETPVSRDWE